ncbi:leucine-rich repeat domain-containing protein [Cerasicoccus maritimus]|uniref:leucine-rich repeat domain-containing protein n=1 Tax=Cerasicoccus maritimus TaxID=490089 RepID=UPI002852BEB8|nr:leucine-rich repeat domain-containing protein [Cerasicoccus maritimus]
MAVIFLYAKATLVQAAQFGDFTYDTNFGEAIITGYTGVGGEVTIPESINGQSVTEIDVGAFAGQGSITALTLPSALLFIRAEAFEYCTGLSNVTIPGGVLEVGEYAFAGCSNLSEVTFESGVSLLLEAAFFGCALERVVLPATIDFIDPGVFADNVQLRDIYFLGDAPMLDSNALGVAGTAYYFTDATGFASQSWTYAPGYSIATVDLGELDRAKAWLLSSHLDYADFLQYPERAPQPVALSYAFNTAPYKPLDFYPALSSDGLYFEIRYYANQDGVSYQPRASGDLLDWSTEGVVIEAMDSDGYRTASVLFAGGTLFFDIQVTVLP